MKKTIQYFLLSILFGLIVFKTSGQTNDELYDLSIEELVRINVMPDKSQATYKPTYELSLNDLMELEIVKELKIDTAFVLSYDVPLEDLLQMKFNVRKKNTIEPTYDFSLAGLTSLELKENVSIKDKIELSYNLSLDGIMKITIE